MIRVELDIKGLKEFRELVRRYPAALRSELTLALLQGALMLQGEVVENFTQDYEQPTGFTRQSFTVPMVVTEDGKTLASKLFSKAPNSRVLNETETVIFPRRAKALTVPVDGAGVLPGQKAEDFDLTYVPPPADAHPVFRGRLVRPGTDETVFLLLAWVRIKAKGTPPYFTRAVRDTKGRILDRIKEGVNRAAEKAGGGAT